MAEGATYHLADNPEWRQVIQFYAVGLEQQQANAFLPDLAIRNPELAGYCLAGARPSDGAAAAVLDGLDPVDGVRLTALAAATMSPRLSVQQMAIERLRQVLAGPGNPLAGIEADVDSMLPLLNSLAGTNAAEIAGLVPQIIEQVPDDPRLIEPLWRCLAAPGIESRPACRAIVVRLLGLATTPDGFAELARQDRYSRDFLTEELRRQAYPFGDGLDPHHNLVTLLAWAQYLDVTPTEPNRYFEAKIAGRLDRLEVDRKRTVSFTLFWPARIFSAVYCLAAVVAALAILVADPGRLLHPIGWWTPALVVGLALVTTGLAYGVDAVIARLPDDSKILRYLPGVRDDEFGHIIDALQDLAYTPEWMLVIIFFGLIPIAIAMSALLIAGHSLITYCLVSLLCGLLYLVPASGVFDRSRRYYLYRPNPYVDVYDDPRSRLWVTSPVGPDEVAASNLGRRVAVPSG